MCSDERNGSPGGREEGQELEISQPSLDEANAGEMRTTPRTNILINLEIFKNPFNFKVLLQMISILIHSQIVDIEPHHRQAEPQCVFVGSSSYIVQR